MKKILIICLILISIGVHAQKEAYNWTFGDKSGLTWNATNLASNYSPTRINGHYTTAPSRIPAPLTPIPQIKTYEGCFTLSDKNGLLMFYSDGKKLYDYKGIVLNPLTDLGGHQSSAQSGVLMPYPGRPNVYIALSIGEKANMPSGQNPKSPNFFYTVIDATGGRDNIVLERVRVPMEGYTNAVGESLGVVKHRNGRDFWIVAPSYSGQYATLNAWLVTSEGVPTTAVKSPITLTPITGGGSVFIHTRYFKFSPSGNAFAWVCADPTAVFLGDFDSSTGIFSGIRQFNTIYPNYLVINGVTVPNPDTRKGAAMPVYGLEFSKSGKNIFISGSSYLICANFNTLKNPNGTYIPYTHRIDLGSITGANQTIGSPQLGPDGYIYATVYDELQPPKPTIENPMRGTTGHLLVITEPERADGTFSNMGIWLFKNYLPGGGGHEGITSFCPSWFALKLDGPSQLCADAFTNSVTDTWTLELDGSSEDKPDRLTWYWDYPGSSISIPNPGTSVQRTYTYTGITTKTTKTIKVEAYKNNVRMEQYDQYLEITLYPKPAATAPLGPITIDTGTEAILEPAWVSSGTTVKWYNAASGGTQLASTGTNSATTGNLSPAGIYTFYMEISNPGCGASRYPVQVTVEDPQSNVCNAEVTPSSTTICAGGFVTLRVTGTTGTVKWYNAATGGTLLGSSSTLTVSPTSTTTYYAEVDDSAGCSASSGRFPATVTVNPLPTVTVNPPAAICVGERASLSATASAGATIRWYYNFVDVTPASTGNTWNPSIPLTATTDFYVEAYNPTTGCKSVRQTVTVTVNEAPTINALPEVTICSGGTATLVASSPSSTLTWYDVPAGGSALPNSDLTGGTFVTETLTADKTYYVEAQNGTCTSQTRQAIKVRVTECGSKELPVNPHLRSFYK